MAVVKAEITPVVSIEASAGILPWVAVVYSPHKQVQPRADLNELLGNSVAPPQPAYPIVIGLSLVRPAGYKEGMGIDARSLLLKPGTNMGVSASDWESCANHTMIAPKIQAGIIRAYTPVSYGAVDDDGVATLPGFCCFSVEDAIALINSTLHEDWIDEWLVGESRLSVLSAAALQKAELIKIKEARAAS